MRYLFVLRAYPDVDHLAPVMWKLLQQGAQVHAIVSAGYDADADYRLRFLRAHEGFRLRKAGWSNNLLHWSFWYLLRHRIGLVAVEWGHGVVDAYAKRRSPRAAARLLKDLLVSFRDAHREPLILRSNMIVAGWMLGRKLVALPHGLNVKLDAITTDAAARVLGQGPYPWAHQNRFDAYVLNTEHHRRWYIEYAQGDPRVMQTWGSARWAPEWVDVNRRIAPAFSWPEAAAEGKARVVLMVPKWKKRVDAPAVADLVRRLQACEGCSLAIKGHPRPEDGSADPLRSDPEIDWSQIHDVTHVDSTSLISASDVVLDAGSSIGIEVLMQDKVLVNLAYVHEITTLFDEIDGIPRAERPEDVLELVSRVAAGDLADLRPGAREELLRRAVFGPDPTDQDILGLYVERLGSIAAGRLQSDAAPMPTNAEMPPGGTE